MRGNRYKQTNSCTRCNKVKKSIHIAVFRRLFVWSIEYAMYLHISTQLVWSEEKHLHRFHLPSTELLPFKNSDEKTVFENHGDIKPNNKRQF